MDISLKPMCRLLIRSLPYVIPTVLSAVAARQLTVINVLLYVLSHFVLLFLTPRFRGTENIGMFVMLSVSTVPINLRIAVMLFPMLDLFDINLLTGILRCVIAFSILFSVEQLIMGFLTRIMKPRQRGLRFRQKKNPLKNTDAS